MTEEQALKGLESKDLLQGEFFKNENMDRYARVRTKENLVVFINSKED